jgi:signal peptidase I
MKKRRRRNTRRSEFIKAAIIVILIGLVVRIFALFPYRIAAADMENSLCEGDFLLSSQLVYKFGEPEVGDVVVFEHPFKIGEWRVGRIIATEGQTVEIIDKFIYINDEPLADFKEIKHVDLNILPIEYSNRDCITPVNIPPGAVFILGDNRDVAEDSRNFGPVNVDNIKGKGLFVYWSWKPDPGAPEWKSPYIIPAIQILFYNLFHFPSRIGWDRLGAAVN